MRAQCEQQRYFFLIGDGSEVHMDRMGQEHEFLTHSMFLPHEIVASLHAYGPAFFERFLIGEPGVPDAEQRELMDFYSEVVALNTRSWFFQL